MRRRYESVISDDNIDYIMHRLNHRPGKARGYRALDEVFVTNTTQLTGVVPGS